MSQLGGQEPAPEISDRRFLLWVRVSRLDGAGRPTRMHTARSNPQCALREREEG